MRTTNKCRPNWAFLLGLAGIFGVTTDGQSQIVLGGSSVVVNNFQFSFNSQPGTAYQVQVAAALSNPNWSVVSNVSGTGSPILVSDPIGVRGSGFYRVSVGGAYYSVNSVGFVQRLLATGTNLVANPLYAANVSLGALFPNPPDGSTAYFWNGAGFNVSSYSGLGGGWDSPQMSLPPGTGMIFNNPGAPFAVIFVGEVPQGTLVNNFAAGYSLKSSIAPVAGLLGFVPQDGDLIQTWNSGAQAFETSQFDFGSWDPSAPFINLGESFWLLTASGRTWTQQFTLAGPTEPPNATVLWDGGGNGTSWTDPLNWVGDALPQAGDDVVIDVPGNPTIQLVTGTQAIRSLVSQEALVLSGGTLTVANASQVNASVTFSDGALAGSGDVTVTGALNWTGGTMSGSGRTIIGSTGTLSLSGGIGRQLRRVLQNEGTATWTGGDLPMFGGTFNNNGSFTASSAAQLRCYGASGVNAFNNAGTFTQQGAGLTLFDVNNTSVPFNNSGTVAVPGGTLGLDAGGTHSSDFAVASGATLRLNGTHSFGVGSDITGAGNLNVAGGTLTNAGTVDVEGATFANGTATFSGSFSVAALTLSGTVYFSTPSSATVGGLTFSGGALAGSGDVTVTGALNWTGGTMSGSGRTIIGSTGTLSLGADTGRQLNRVLQNEGTATWTAGALPMIGGTFNNNGSFTASSAAQLRCYGSGGISAFNNAGTFTQQGAGLTLFNVSSTGVSFNNSGTVAVLGGTLTFNSGFIQTSGQTILTGGAIAASSALQIQGGVLGGVGTISASVNNSGTVSPGASPGLLSITGNYTQSATGTLDIEVGGLSPGTTYDQFAVSGTATLAGLLRVRLINDYIPATGVVYRLVNYGSVSGSFSEIQGLFPTPEVRWVAVYKPTGLDLDEQLPGIGVQPLSQSVSSGASVTLVVTPTGTGPFTYQWRRNGVNIPGANNATLTIPSAEAGDGGTYTVVIQNAYGLVSSVTATLEVFLSTVDLRNDFGDRQVLPEDSGQGFAFSTNATREPGEPQHAGLTNDASMWITWQPSASGIATVTTAGSDFDTVQAIYTGTALNNLVEVAADDDSGASLTSSNRFNVTAGTEYHIAVAGFAGAQGRIVLQWSREPTTDPLPEITSQPQSQTRPLGGTVNFTVTATGATPLSYQWFRNDQSLVGQTADTLSLSDLQPTAVGWYFVRIQDVNGKALNSRTASLELGPDPNARSEDKLANLTYAGPGGPVLSGLGDRRPRLNGEFTVALGIPGSQIFSTFGATAQEGERDSARVIGGSSRWFEVIVTEAATLALDTLGSDFDTTLALYRGSDLLDLQLIVEDDNGAGDGLRSRAVVSVAAGKYLVKVDGRDGQQGTAQLNWVLGLGPTLALQQPAQVVLVPAGGTFQLNLTVGGVPVPTLEWYRNGTFLPQWTGPALTLANVTAAVAGQYRARAYNALGEVASPWVTLLIDDGTVMRFAPNAVLAGGNFDLQFAGPPGVELVIYASTNLQTWLPVHTNSGVFTFRDSTTATSGMKFYKGIVR